MHSERWSRDVAGGVLLIPALSAEPGCPVPWFWMQVSLPCAAYYSLDPNISLSSSLPASTNVMIDMRWPKSDLELPNQELQWMG